MFLQPGCAVGQQARVVRGQQLQQAFVTCLGVELQQCSVYILSEAIGTLASTHLTQVADEEALAGLHFLLITLRQMVQIGELVQWRMAPCERR